MSEKLELYTEEELDLLEGHIQKYFGEFENVYHEIASPDIHVDLCLIAPTPERNYWILVTMGMGAHRMNVPEELEEYKLTRAEIAVALPPDWKVGDSDERWYWPLRWLKILARLPLEEDSWLGWGHTVGNPGNEPFAENTGFTGVMLMSASEFKDFDEESAVCQMSDGSEINFYYMVPLYPEEMEYKLNHDGEALLDLWVKDEEEITLLPMDLCRKNVCKPSFTKSPAEITGEEGKSESKRSEPSILTLEDISVLESFQEETGGYFGKMFAYLVELIQNGIAEGRFTEEEAREDRDLALWYAYACNNLDDYEHYYMATQWMPASEKNAAGCGAWYYRYSCALMYCGRLEDARRYAEQGVKEEPDYPWVWLQAAKLRSHFGDRTGAFHAVEEGLRLEPDDYEFLTLRREIEEGKSLPEMEYHFIDPENDKMLQEGQLSESLDKLQVISGIVCNPEGLAAVKEIFGAENWIADNPYCSFRFHVGEHQLEGVFCMNEAAISKMDADWLKRQKDRLTQEEYLVRTSEHSLWNLQLLAFNRDHSAELIYQNPENGQSIGLSIKKNGSDMEVPEPSVIDAALTQAEKSAVENDGSFLMFKLYRKENGLIYYAECWTGEGIITEHTGIVGERGKTQEHSCKSAQEQREYFDSFRQWYLSQGYEEWSQEEMTWMAVQFPITPVNLNAAVVQPEEQDLLLREAAQAILNESLGWNGLGHVDGWEMGRRLDSPQDFVLNLYCLVLDSKRALPVIRRDLEENLDCSHMKIAAMKPGSDAYELIWSGDGSAGFSL